MATPSMAGSGAPAVLALAGGIVWDYDGSGILRSTDAGATWGPVFPTWPLTQTSLQVTGAFFLNAEDAWAETEHQWPAPPGATTIWQTTDGGTTWHQGTSLPGAPSYGTPGFDQFAFANTAYGFGFGVGTGFEYDLWATSNGGRDWHQVSAKGLPLGGTTFPAPATGCHEPGPFNLTAVSASVVLLAEAGCPVKEPGLWRSRNGGREWARAYLPAPPGGWSASEAWPYPTSGESGAQVLAIRFFGVSLGVAAVTTRPGRLLVYRSANAGQSWSLASVLDTGSLSRPAGFSAPSQLAWVLPAPAGLYLTTDGGQHWGLQRSHLSLPLMTEVGFASPRDGLGFAPGSYSTGLTGYAGMKTTDAGRTWQAVQFSAPSFLGNPTTEVPFSVVDFANREDGWIAGTDGVEATTNGGVTWTAQLATSEPVEELSFADAEHGWALTPDELYATSDGGLEWSVEPETGLGAFSFVQLVSPDFGVAAVCGQTGGTRVLATYDHGASWSLLPVPDPDELDCGGPPASSGTTSGLCFGTAKVAWAVLHGPGEAPAVVEKSDDGGGHWSAMATVNTSPGALACQGTSDAWLGLNWMENMANVGALAATTDGGQTWRISVHPAPHTPYPVPVIRPSDGTAVGPLGTAQSPAGILMQPVAALSAAAPDDAVDLWEDYGPSCANGFGLALTSDGGASWAGAPGRSLDAPPCGPVALPFLSAVPNIAPSFSFHNADDGFVLGPASATPVVPKGITEKVTMALVATADGGKNWRLVARFPWN